MFTQELFPRIGIGLVGISLSLILPDRAQAAAVTYAIDDGLSLLNLSGSFRGFTFSPQTADALSDHFVGTIAGDLSGGVLTFSGGSSISALENGVGPFQPMSGGASGSAPGNYGVVIPSIGEFGAYRSLVFDIISGAVANGSAPSVNLAYVTGVLDYAGSATGPGQLNFAGASGSDGSGAIVSLTTVGTTETLTLPFTFALNVPNGPQQTFDGTIVATRTVAVPEPSTIVLGVAGATILWLLRRRHRKSS